MTRNPIYQAFLVSGFMRKLEEAARHAGEHAGMLEAVRRDRAALRSMWDRGVIDYSEYVDLRMRVSRTLHARLLRDAMRQSSVAERRRTTRAFRRFCPPGMSSYAVRMGHALRAGRRDLA